MTGLETSAAKSAKIVTTDDTLKVDRTVALPTLEDGMNNGLQKLVAEHEASAFEPVRLDPGPSPVMLSLSDLRLHEEAQHNGFQRMDEIFRQAKADQDEISADLRGDLIAEKKQAIKREAMEKARQFFAPMVERAKTAAASAEFYERQAVLRRARFSRDDQVHYAATASWVARLNASPAFFLSGFARDAVVTQNPALASLALEAAHQRNDVSDKDRHGVQAVIATLTLPEADEGLKLIQSIIDTKSKAESALRVFQTGRADAVSKITLGLRNRAD